jgi:hypothetical protein
MKTIAAALFVAGVAQAGLPPVELIDPQHPSREEHGTATINGNKVPVVIKFFGSDKITAAQEYGKSLAPMYYASGDLDHILIERGNQLFHDAFQAKVFKQYATSAYQNQMKNP